MKTPEPGRETDIALAADGIVVIGSDFRIITCSDSAGRITGFEPDKVIGKSYSIFFRKEIVKSYLEKVKTSGFLLSNIQTEVKCINGELKKVVASMTPIVRDGEVLSVIVMFRDTQEMLNLTRTLNARTSELIDERNKLEAIFNSNIEGTFTIDNSWTITSFNLSAAKITGYRREEAIGKKCWEIFRSSICRNGCHMERTLSRGKPGIGNELEIYRKNGTSIPIRVNSAVLLNNKGIKIGAVETFIDISEVRNLSEHIGDRFRFSNIIGRSKAMESIFYLFESVSKTDSTVLLTGESGTGKELAARAIHLNSTRSRGPFIALNCSAFAENLIESELFGHQEGAFTGATRTKTGKFELAQGGTLFLDEIGEISLSLQVKLLRVIESRQFERVGSNKPVSLDARIITATNRDLLSEIREGRFREDLYYRINVMNIHLPPLRERADDLPLLLDHFIKQFNGKFTKSINSVSKDVYEALAAYNWPGNIRELENVVEHAFILCQGSRIEKEHIPRKLLLAGGGTHASENAGSFSAAEKEVIVATLEKNHWNKKATASELGIDVSTLWRKMKKYKMQ